LVHLGTAEGVAAMSNERRKASTAICHDVRPTTQRSVRRA
jgi:hypothetical protein